MRYAYRVVVGGRSRRRDRSNGGHDSRRVHISAGAQPADERARQHGGRPQPKGVGMRAKTGKRLVGAALARTFTVGLAEPVFAEGGTPPPPAKCNSAFRQRQRNHAGNRLRSGQLRRPQQRRRLTHSMLVRDLPRPASQAGAAVDRDGRPLPSRPAPTEAETGAASSRNSPSIKDRHGE